MYLFGKNGNVLADDPNYKSLDLNVVAKVGECFPWKGIVWRVDGVTDNEKIVISPIGITEESKKKVDDLRAKEKADEHPL